MGEKKGSTNNLLKFIEDCPGVLVLEAVLKPTGRIVYVCMRIYDFSIQATI